MNSLMHANPAYYSRQQTESCLVLKFLYNVMERINVRVQYKLFFT